MIVFDLKCPNNHVFEAWFKNSAAFEKQRKDGLIVCPVCGNSRIEKALSPVKFKKSHGGKGDGVLSQEAMAEVVSTFYRKMMDSSEDVGEKFASEALKMHYGVSKPRSIRGVATKEEEDMLMEEGVDFFRIPVASKKGDKSN